MESNRIEANRRRAMWLMLRTTPRDFAFFPDKLCARRILCFLKRRHLDGAAHQLERQTAVFFDMSHLRYLAMTGRWDELTAYVDPFLPSPTSFQATAFLHCIHIYRVLGTICAGGRRLSNIDRLYPLLDDAAAKANPHRAALHAFFHDVRKRPPRDMETWMQVWEKAAERLKKLALKCPELKGKLHLQVSQYAPKRWQINLSGVRPVPRAYKKKGNKPKACDISCFYEQKRKEINERLSGFSSNGTMIVYSKELYERLSGFSSNETSRTMICYSKEVYERLSGFSSNGTSCTMICPSKELYERLSGFSSNVISDMQIEPAVPKAPGVDTTAVEGMLGGNGNLGNKAGVGASESRKRKMSATPETDTEASASMKICEGSCSHL